MTNIGLGIINIIVMISQEELSIIEEVNISNIKNMEIIIAHKVIIIVVISLIMYAKD